MARRSRSSGEAIILPTSWLSRWAISGASIAGAKSPIQLLALAPGNVSATVGRSGNAGERAVPAIAIGRSLPDLTCGNTVGTDNAASETSPRSSASSDSPSPL